jgi:1-acyl-sn-glycerol-3-phosphate acyltransferase
MSEPRTFYVSWFWNRLVRTFFDLVFLVAGGIRVRGKENIPRTGGLIVASNHMSHLDPPALACAIRRRILMAMAKEELFRHKVFGWVIFKMGAFPVRRGEGDTDALRHAIAALQAGHSMIVFPEGTRGDGVHFQALEKGATFLARKTGVPILPVGIHGTQFVSPRGKLFGRRHRVTVVCGKPFTYADVESKYGVREAREKFLDELEDRILSACKDAGLELKTSALAEATQARPSHET